jgi:hypothetical protein
VRLLGNKTQIVKQPTHITFSSRAAVTIDWLALGHISTRSRLEYSPELSKARVVDPEDGAITSYPMLVEGGPEPKAVTFAFSSPLCTADSPPWTCIQNAQDTIVFGTFTCVPEAP